MNPAVVHRISIHRLSIPLRVSVQHAAAERAVGDPVVVEVELVGGTRGFGESLARSYVTGESAETVAKAIERDYSAALLGFHPESFPAALEFIEALPWTTAEGNKCPAARAAVELALLDVCMRYFQRGVEDMVQWMGLPHFGRHGSMRTARFGGVLTTNDLVKMRKQLRLMYWGGLREFKVKVGTDGDADRVRAAARYLAGPMAEGKVSLRVDANGAWNIDQAAEWLSGIADVRLAGVEQPLPRGQEESLRDLRGGSDALLVHDESLIFEADARRLIELGVADAFNIRISKCGGFLPSLRLAGLARKHGVRVQLGCMVGETSILSAAGLRFLEVCPEVRWAEGCFGNFLLRGDVVRKGLRFGYGGRLPRLGGVGWGIEVVDVLVDQHETIPPTIVNL